MRWYNLLTVFFLSLNVVLIGSTTPNSPPDCLPWIISDDRGTYCYNPEILAYVFVPGSEPKPSPISERLKIWWDRRFVKVVQNGSPIPRESPVRDDVSVARISDGNPFGSDLGAPATQAQSLLTLPHDLDFVSGSAREVRGSKVFMASANSGRCEDHSVRVNPIALGAPLAVLEQSRSRVRTVTNVKLLSEEEVDDL